MEKLAVIRIRSNLRKARAVKAVTDGLNLRKLYSCVLMDKSDSNLGMLSSAESVLTYGEIDKETLKKLLLKRGRVSNAKKYEWDEAKLNSFAEEFMDGKRTLNDMKIKRVFNLHPPIKGFERMGKKTPYTLKGVFGYRGAAINSLLQRMI